MKPRMAEMWLTIMNSKGTYHLLPYGQRSGKYAARFRAWLTELKQNEKNSDFVDDVYKIQDVDFGP